MGTPICKLEHENLLIKACAPLGARTTAIEVWCRCFPRWHPLVVEVFDHGHLAALAMLGWRRRWGWIEVIRLGPQDEVGCVVSSSAEAAARLASDVRRALDALRWPWRLRLVNLRRSDLPCDALVAALPLLRCVAIGRSAELDVSSGTPFSKVVSRNTRSAVAKARNRIVRGGHRLDLLWLRDPADIARALPDVLRVHQARNAQLRRDQLARDPAIAEHVCERVLAHAQEGCVELLLTCVDQHLAAFALCFRSSRVLHVFANLTSPDCLQYSTGAIANHEVIARAWADPQIDIVDWGLGLQRYKLSGPIEIVAHQSLEAFSSLTTRLCIRAAEHACSSMGKLLRRWSARSAE